MAMESLEKRIEALEIGTTFDVTQTAIRKREEEMLVTLRTIRDQMAKEAAESATTSANSTKLNDLKTENEKLKATITKQEYRIRHLISGMEELLAAKN